MALTGQSPVRFIQVYRLKQSVDLLKIDPGRITDSHEFNRFKKRSSFLELNFCFVIALILF